VVGDGRAHQHEHLDPEDTDHATPHHRVDCLDPDRAWHFFTLVRPGPSIGKTLLRAGLVASWLDEFGRRVRGPILSSFIYA
jgi:hypothetical protein